MPKGGIRMYLKYQLVNSDNGRLFHDNSDIKVQKVEKGPTKIWDLTVDELIGLPSTGIYSKNNEFVENMCQCIQAQQAK